MLLVRSTTGLGWWQRDRRVTQVLTTRPRDQPHLQSAPDHSRLPPGARHPRLAQRASGLAAGAASLTYCGCRSAALRRAGGGGRAASSPSGAPENLGNVPRWAARIYVGTFPCVDMVNVPRHLSGGYRGTLTRSAAARTGQKPGFGRGSRLCGRAGRLPTGAPRQRKRRELGVGGGRNGGEEGARSGLMRFVEVRSRRILCSASSSPPGRQPCRVTPEERAQPGQS
jgi:hypothetical protein